MNEYNNFSIAVLDNSKSALNFTVMEDNYNDDNSLLELSVKLENNTNANQNVELIMAAYDTYGMLQKITNELLEMEMGENTITKQFDCSEFTFKLFVWDSLNGMKPIGF